MKHEKSEVEVNAKSSGCGCGCVEKKKWEKPKLEDVSGKVMAQPYIRFT